MYEQLLRIKRRREDSAAAAVAEARRAAQAADDARRDKERELKAFVGWHVNEKERLFREVGGRNVTRKDLDRYREDIGVLRQRQIQLEEELAAAERAVSEAEAAVESARQRRIAANREVVKFEEYGSMLAAEEARAAQRREDSEADDIAARRV